MTDNLKQRSGAEMRALRDQRLAAQADPASEARRRETSFLKNLTGARDDYNWIVEHKAWTHLGYDNYTAWYVARVQPMLMAIGAKPTPELSADVIRHARDEDAELPGPQRRTQREVAEMAMTSQATVSRSARDSREYWSDLDKAPKQARSQSAPESAQPQPIAVKVLEQDPEPAHCPTCGQPLKEQRR